MPPQPTANPLLGGAGDFPPSFTGPAGLLLGRNRNTVDGASGAGHWPCTQRCGKGKEVEPHGVELLFVLDHLCGTSPIHLRTGSRDCTPNGAGISQAVYEAPPPLALLATSVQPPPRFFIFYFLFLSPPGKDLPAYSVFYGPI